MNGNYARYCKEFEKISDKHILYKGVIYENGNGAFGNV